MWLVDGLGDTLDTFDEGAGHSCVRMVLAEPWPSLHDVRSVMSFLVRPVAILTSQFFLSYEDGGEDWYSPMICGRVPLPCPVDLDSLYMFPMKTGRYRKLGPHAEVWDWRGILKNVASSSQLPELLDSDRRDRFRNLGRTCVLDLNVRETNSDVQPLGGGCIVSDGSPLELCVRETNSDVQPLGGGCIVSNCLSFIPYC